MIPVYYDLHIHSALSPCAADDMTPNDIIGMALLNGLDLIAITDHNSISNAISVTRAAQGKDLIVIPGIEVSTVEEVHVLCLFHNIETAVNFENDISSFFSAIQNRVDIFGNQTIYDEKDNIAGTIERMLIAPTSISFDTLYEMTHKHGGAFIPAHIDRSSFSVISNLGFIPPHLEINTVEISQGGLERGFCEKQSDQFKGKKAIFSSDAHELWVINEKENYLLLPERSAVAAIDFLR